MFQILPCSSIFHNNHHKISDSTDYFSRITLDGQEIGEIMHHCFPVVELIIFVFSNWSITKEEGKIKKHHFCNLQPRTNLFQVRNHQI